MGREQTFTLGWIADVRSTFAKLSQQAIEEGTGLSRIEVDVRRSPIENALKFSGGPYGNLLKVGRKRGPLGGYDEGQTMLCQRGTGGQRRVLMKTLTKLSEPRWRFHPTLPKRGTAYHI